jgi:hypothetical protein
MARVETLGALNNEAFIQISSDCTNLSSIPNPIPFEVGTKIFKANSLSTHGALERF